MEFKKFEYDGPILFYTTVACPKWKATTHAVSKNKAINNFKYQAKKFLGKNQLNKISLPGEIVEGNI